MFKFKGEEFAIELGLVLVAYDFTTYPTLYIESRELNTDPKNGSTDCNSLCSYSLR